MPDIGSTTAIQIGVLLAILIGMIAGAFWLLARFRDYTAHDQFEQPPLLTNLEEMRSRGDISDEEFRTIQRAAEQGVTRTPSDDETAGMADSPSTGTNL
ncbi:MAG: hypothetical protein AAGD07_18390 [Planctomycetota bacterium]